MVDVQIRAMYPQSQCFLPRFDFEMLVLDLDMTDLEEEEDAIEEEGGSRYRGVEMFALIYFNDGL